MHRRTFLRAAGATTLGASAGCSGLLPGRQQSSEQPRGTWRQAAGGPGNAASAPTVRAAREVWRASLPDGPASPPVVANGVVVTATTGGTVLVVDLATGEEQWRQRTAGVQGTPAAVGEWVVVPGDDGRLHRFRLATGDAAEPIQLGTSILGSVTVADGRAYVLVRPERLVALDVASWKVLWSRQVSVRGVGKPAVADGRVFVSGTSREVDEHASVPGTGTVVAFDAASGAVAWQAATTRELSPTPVVSAGSVVVGGAHDNRLESESSSTAQTGAFWLGAAHGSVERTEPLRAPIWGHCRARFFSTRDGLLTVSGCNALVQYAAVDGSAWSETVPHGITTRPLWTPDGLLVGDSQGRLSLVSEGAREDVSRVPGMPATPAVLERGLVVPAGRSLVAFA